MSPAAFVYVVGLLLLAAGCAPTADSPSATAIEEKPAGANVVAAIGRLQIEGPEVTLNGVPADNDAQIRHGDRVATGAGSSARLDLVGGGFVQIGPGTSPVWYVDRTTGSCSVTVAADTGRVYGETGVAPQGCHIVADAFTIYSRFSLELTGERRVFTLLGGSADIAAVGGASRKVQPGQQVVVEGADVVSIRALPLDELTRSISWRDAFVISHAGVRTGTLVPMPRTEPPGDLAVPDLVGRNLDEASSLAALYSGGIAIVVVGRQPSVHNLPGQIDAQVPQARSTLTPDRTIYVVLAEAATPAPLTSEVTRANETALTLVPDVVGRKPADAVDLLDEAGFFTHFVGDAAKGAIFEQIPAAGARRPAGSYVILSVAGAESTSN